MNKFILGQIPGQAVATGTQQLWLSIASLVLGAITQIFLHHKRKVKETKKP